ncbi:unnamed protein product [Closterium sp. NIES-65]|nr:unnamed protein product [Closterium sp. NIES-65]
MHAIFLQFLRSTLSRHSTRLHFFPLCLPQSSAPPPDALLTLWHPPLPPPIPSPSRPPLPSPFHPPSNSPSPSLPAAHEPCCIVHPSTLHSRTCSLSRHSLAFASFLITLPFFLVTPPSFPPPPPFLSLSSLVPVGRSHGKGSGGGHGMEPSQARGSAAGEQQARGAPGRAAGARATGQQRRPYQRLRLQYRPCHRTPLEPTPPQVQVRPFKPRSPCPLAIEAPIPSACTTQSAKFPPCLHPRLQHRFVPLGLQLVAVPPPVAPPPFPCAGFQVTVAVGRGGGQHSTRLGWDGRVSGLGRLNQGCSSIAAGQHGGSRRAAGGQQDAHTEVALPGDIECTHSICSPPNPPTAEYPRASPILPTLPPSVAFHVLPFVTHKMSCTNATLA